MKKPNLRLGAVSYFAISFIATLFALHAEAQVKIGNNVATINSNSLLELESTNKGFLPPRVAINDLSSVSPLTGTVPAGMLVFSSGGSVADGYYYWDGTKWASVGSTGITTKTADATLTKNETLVLASGDITITLPTVTAADDGLTMTVKNNGIAADLVVVKGSGPATVDGLDSSTLTRWIGETYVAKNGNWLIKNKIAKERNVFNVSPTSSWSTLEEVISFLGEHMTAASVIRMDAGEYTLTSKQVIDLDYPVTIQSISYSVASFKANSGLDTMFSCRSETYFKMLSFEGTTSTVGIGLIAPGEYHEIKDCSFERFSKAIVAKSNVSMWVFEVDVTNATTAGIEVAASGTDSVTLKVSETDFTNCAKGINLASGNRGTISILNCTFYNSTGQTGVYYDPSNFTNFVSMFITNNAWNNIGTFFSGFDFSRSDGRDANAFLQNNAGDGDKHPTCRINVQNNTSTTTVSSAGVIVKAVWTNTSSTKTKWTIDNNKITYQPSNKRNVVFYITGNITVGNANETVSISIIKNNVTSNKIGETDLRVTLADKPFQFATVIYLEDVQQGDYFELFCTSATPAVITFRDVQWFTDTK